MAQPILYLMLGYPGAGKTTSAEIIARLTGAVHLSSDKIRLEMFPNPSFSQSEHTILYKAIDSRTKELLKTRQSVVYDANLNRYQHRKEKYDICKTTGARPLLLWIQTSKHVAKERAAHVDRLHLVPINESPEEMFDRIAGVIEPPEADEAFLAVNGEEISEDSIRRLLSQQNIL